MGVDSIELGLLEEISDVFILDVDKNEFLKMLTLPNRGELYEKLRSQLSVESSFSQSDESRASCIRQPYRNSPKDLEYLHEIVDELRDYFQALLDRVLQAQDSVVPFSASDSSSIAWDQLSDDAVLDQIVSSLKDEEERPFAKRLLETQHYRFYVERIRGERPK